MDYSMTFLKIGGVKMNSLRDDVYKSLENFQKLIKYRKSFNDVDPGTLLYTNRIESYIIDKCNGNQNIIKKCTPLSYSDMNKLLLNLADVYEIMDSIVESSEETGNEWIERIRLDRLLGKSFLLIKNIFTELKNADMEKEFKYRNILKITEFLDNYEKYEERGLSEYKFLELTDMLNDSREILHTIKYFIKLLPAEFCDFIQPLTIDVTEHIKAISEFLSREEIKTLSGKVYDDFREIYNEYKQ